MKHHLKPLAACMAALFGATSFNVYGAPPATPPVQNQTGTGTGAGTGVPAVAVPPTMEPKPTISLFPAPPKEFPGIPWGSFLAYPEISLSVTHDDNIYALRSFPIDDVIFTLSPSLELKSNWTRHELNFDIGGDFDRYREHDSENVNDYWAGFDGHYDLSAATNVFGGARYSRDHEDRSTPGEPLLQSEPTRYDHGEAHLGVAHSSGAFRLRIGGTWDQYDYIDGTSLLGGAIDQDYRDHDLTSFGVRLGYVMSPRYELFGQYASDTREYDKLINTQTFNRDSDGYRLAGGVRFTLAPQRVAGEVYAGVMSQDFDYTGFSDLDKPYFGALAVWKPTPQITATGFIDRSLVETTVFNGADYASSSLDTTYGFEVERRLTSKLSVSGRAAYTSSDFQSYDRSDTIIDAGAGVRYYVAPAIFVGADLRVIDRDSSELGAQYSSNQVMLNVGYTPARSRDYAIIPEQEAGAAEAPRTLGLYSGFYAGLQLGHGGLTTSTWGPRDGGGFDDADMGGFGGSYSLFAGWGTEFADNWYAGVEVEGGDSDASWYHRKDTATAPTVSVDKGTSYGVSLRAGYQLDGGLLYGTLGVVNTDFHTYYAENQYLSGAFDQKESENGTRIGLGLDIPASRNLFVRTAYSYTRFDDYDVTYQSDAAATTTESFETSETVFSLGLGWRFGDDRPEPPARPATETRGLYLGASLGHGTLGTELTGTHNVGAGDFAFYGDFARSGFTGGFFAGYGYTFDRFYLGLELDTEAANFGWNHSRDTGGGGGRNFSAEKRGSYGAGLRLGYVLNNGGLLYGRVGAVQTRFNTFYDRGNNPATAVTRSDDLDGTRFGLGAEIPASQNTFVRMDYSYTDYNDSVSFLTTQGVGPDAMNFENSESLVRLGLGFRF